MDIDLWRAEEFKALRAEILANMDYQKTLIVWGTTAPLTALGFAFGKTGATDFNAYIYLLVQVVVTGIWYAWEHLAVHTERIGTYIAVMEREVKGLGWETHQRNWADAGKGTPLKSFVRFVASSAVALPFLAIDLFCLRLQFLCGFPDQMTRTQWAAVVFFSIAVVVALVSLVLKNPKRLRKDAERRMQT